MKSSVASEAMKILAIDDIQDNLLTLRALVRDAFPSARFVSAQNGGRGIELAHAEDPDVILLDIIMPGMDGFEVCRRLKADARTVHIPVIFLTALQTDRNSRMKAVEAGGEAFLSKPIDEVELTALIQAMAKIKKGNVAQRLEKEQLAALVRERTIELEQEFAEHRKVTAALRESEKAWRQTFDSVPDLISIIDSDHTVLKVNRPMADRLGLAPEGVVGRKCHELVHGLDQPPQYCPHAQRQRNEQEACGMAELESLGGVFDISVSPMSDSQGKLSACVHVMRDITARKQAEEEKALLEAKLQQAQKIESVGQLAGGVAHDFNNMLGVILGHADLLMMEMDPKHPYYADLQEIRKAAERSASLTRQLLAFARKQTVAPRVLDLNETVSGMLNMLKRLISEDIALAWHPEEHLWAVRMDPSQIDQILANLCVNARDSITGIGTINIETGNVTVGMNQGGSFSDFEPGEYVCLTVSDNGHGMDLQTQARIFEPFFTTKGVGVGTGLGLSTVYGAVKQNNGYIDVDSEPGIGTTFRIYFPRYRDCSEKLPQKGDPVVLAQGHETILVVEDEPTILKLVSQMLEKLGYVVLAANNANEAMYLSIEYSGEISLLITDVVMPEMNGRDISSSILSKYPQIKCLYMSGYTADVIAHRGILRDDVSYIQKPFSIAELAAKVREVLDGQ